MKPLIMPGAAKVIHRGRVKMFNEVKGFGFIQRDGLPDLFVHCTQIRGAGNRKTLSIGDVVTFEVGIGKGDKPRALNVIVNLQGK